MSIVCQFTSCRVDFIGRTYLNSSFSGWRYCMLGCIVRCTYVKRLLQKLCLDLRFVRNLYVKQISYPTVVIFYYNESVTSHTVQWRVWPKNRTRRHCVDVLKLTQVTPGVPEYSMRSPIRLCGDYGKSPIILYCIRWGGLDQR